MARRRLSPALRGTLMLCLLPLAGCPVFDVSQPITLVHESDWNIFERQTLQQTAECWNLRFGTKLRLGSSGDSPQQTSLAFSEFACLRAAGITTGGLPARVFICPPRLLHESSALAEQQLFDVLLHELGHVLNIRSHARDQESVMSLSGDPVQRFTDEDASLFRDANEGFDAISRCTTVTIADGRPPYCACSQR